MRTVDQERARGLRAKGYSIRKIAQEVKASQSSISKWVRTVQLTSEQLAVLRDNEPRQKLAVTKAQEKWKRLREEYKQEAEQEYLVFSQNPIFMLGLGLYAGEGSKTGDKACLSNSDFRIIKIGILFYQLIGIPKENLIVSVAVHSQEQAEPALLYWQEKTGVPKERFNKAVIAISKASQLLRGNTIPMGTCYLKAPKLKPFIKIMRWLELALAPIV